MITQTARDMRETGRCPPIRYLGFKCPSQALAHPKETNERERRRQKEKEKGKARKKRCTNDRRPTPHPLPDSVEIKTGERLRNHPDPRSPKSLLGHNKTRWRPLKNLHLSSPWPLKADFLPVSADPSLDSEPPKPKSASHRRVNPKSRAGP